MRKLLTCLLLAVAALAVPSQAQSAGICDRTPAVRDAILQALGAGDCADADGAGVDDEPAEQQLAGVASLKLQGRGLTALQAWDFDGLTNLKSLFLQRNQLATLPADVFDGLIRLERVELANNRLTALPAGVFDGLARLKFLTLHGNRLAALPAGVFDGLTRLESLHLFDNRLMALPVGVFDDLISMDDLTLRGNRLTALPAGVFDGMPRLRLLDINGNRLTTLPAGVFDGTTNLQAVLLHGNQLTSLPAGAFASKAGLVTLILSGNRLAALPPDVFHGAGLQDVSLSGNRLTTLPRGVFDGVLLRSLKLQGNRLTTLPAGVFDNQPFMRLLDLRRNHLVGLTASDPLFAGVLSIADIRLAGQTPARRSGAAVPLMLSASGAGRQGFVRIVNESEESGSVRISAFDDGGYAPDPIEVRLSAGQAVHLNSNDLEQGDADKGIEGGIGPPISGDWRLGVSTALDVRVLAFVRTHDGFLTAMHDVLPRAADGRLVAQIFNPGSNRNQASRLRLMNTGASAESVSIEGIDDQGETAGPVTLMLAAGESRTLSALDLENGARGLTGRLGDGAGKWRLLVDAADPVVGVGLLEAASGHLTNTSTATRVVDARPLPVPLTPWASGSGRQGFVRIVNESEESGSVRISAFDDGGYAADPIKVQLDARQVVHFNAHDFEYGSPEKGVARGIGAPIQGEWRLNVETALDVRVLAFVRTDDGFLGAMHDMLPRAADGRLVAETFNPGSDGDQVSRLRLVNTGTTPENVRIEGVDDQGATAGPVTSTLAAGESCTLSALDLENGAQGLEGRLGAGAGKWRLFITAGPSVVGMSLLEDTNGHLTNISTIGTEGQ